MSIKQNLPHTILFFFLSVSFATTVSAQNNKYVVDKTIALPGNGGYDYLYIDQANKVLYVSHGTAVNVIDLTTDKVVGTIDSMQGVHGIAIVDNLNRGFISDGKANAVVAFDTKTLKQIKTIPLSGKKPDAIIYDSFSKTIMAFNGSSNDVSVVDPTTMEQIKSIALEGAPEFAVSDGKGTVYNNLEDKSKIAVIDTKAFTATKNYNIPPCGGPTGIAIDLLNKKLFTACRENKGLSVFDIESGKVIQTLPIGAGVDAVAFDEVSKLIIVSNGDGTATIIEQQASDKYAVVQTLSTQERAKTMTLDKVTHKLYFSVADFEKGTRNVLPNSFKVLVYKLQ